MWWRKCVIKDLKKAKKMAIKIIFFKKMSQMRHQNFFDRKVISIMRFLLKLKRLVGPNCLEQNKKFDISENHIERTVASFWRWRKSGIPKFTLFEFSMFSWIFVIPLNTQKVLRVRVSQMRHRYSVFKFLYTLEQRFTYQKNHS